MLLAERIWQGRLDSAAFAGTVDSVTLAGRTYVAVGPLQVVPYLPLVPFPALHAVAGLAIGGVLGALTAWLALPLARAYGLQGARAYWLATFTAFGTLLFYVSIFGDFYYLAHVEAFLAVTLLLLEWAGQRRPLVLGSLFGIALLARPTTVLAVVPFALVLICQRPDRLRTAAGLALPILAAVLIYAGFNWARFGSPFETGYGISYLLEPSLISRRAAGVFSIVQIPENLRLALLQGFQLDSRFPFAFPDPHGLSMLLVSPALLIALRAGLANPLTRLLWSAAILVAIPIFLYYGGGWVQYGFRYSLDVTPFLVVLVAFGMRGKFGLLERALIAISMASVAYGIVWHASIILWHRPFGVA